ncbi:hypothetical protein BU23DRAFT_569682 [Bimuria novae-zelandiae CBS 107.79]|uniref:Uncharacterized protein n=1 Tax=Bimuria novae-zelandiae CBS 107.79 TaxID=1447943 RepID=A0A6A5V3N9_9PLEO|nr:hypothetical protein BU23DRAFT_569682 [Bimuria novae-zelandiae CBS 107.79]
MVGDCTSGEVTLIQNPTKNQKRALTQQFAKTKEEKAGGYATFYRAEPKDVEQECSDWEENNQAGLQKLAGFLKELVEVVGSIKERKALIHRPDRKGPVELYVGSTDMKEALTQEIVVRFWD